MCTQSHMPSLKLDSCKQKQIVVWCKSAIFCRDLNCVYRISSFQRPGALINSDSFKGALIRGGRLYEGGAYLKMLINGVALICTEKEVITN